VQSSFIIVAVKIITLSIVVALQLACESEPVDSYNRRDLYDAERGLVAPKRAPTPEPKPQFR